jgi:preprotein translocase subunit SecA
VTLQNYFRLYDKLAGMTGTAETEAAEFASTYELPVVPIPTNRPMVRQDQADLIYKTELAKFNAVIDDIAERSERGQPILVGTASVEKSEVLSRMLDKRGIAHSVLNAKQHTREAQIVTQAGRLGAVTVATNMAGRGVDILLGGNPEGLARMEVIGQGLDPATEEGQARYQELLPRFETDCKAEGDEIRAVGGLYVLGSERHESRRIDNQLRGRAGRQGDPGESRFYLSLEDELMRLFATGAMNWVMGRALPEDVPIEAKMVSKAIERAQTTVEARNAEIRKDVLKYDEVMNEQRKVVYARRMQIMDGADMREQTLELLEAALQGVVDGACPTDEPEDWDLEFLVQEATGYYPTKFTAEELQDAATRELILESLLAEAVQYYEDREAALPKDDNGDSLMRQVEREIMLQIIDTRWREHLSEMDYLREGINLRAMGQQDPLVAWQTEGFEMFGQMMSGVDDDYVRYAMRAQVQVLEQIEHDEQLEQARLGLAEFVSQEDPVQGEMAIEAAAAPAPAIPDSSNGGVVHAREGNGDAAPVVGRKAVATVAGGGARPSNRVEQGVAGRGSAPGGAVEEAAPPSAAGARQIKKAEHEKLGRNDPCWCGSGKKFKLCHGR